MIMLQKPEFDVINLAFSAIAVSVEISYVIMEMQLQLIKLLAYCPKQRQWYCRCLVHDVATA